MLVHTDDDRSGTPAESASTDEPAGAGLLAFHDVAKDYTTEGGRVEALRGVHLSVAKGEFLALVGRSGCGKSTLLNLAGAMDFPSHGEVLLDGVSTSRLNDAELTRLRRQKVGFIFQSFQLIQTLSVAENVELPLLLAGAGQTRQSALNQLAAVGLGELSERMPHQLSGGQMQRVAIARALVHQPRLLLADEPTGNLDTSTGDSILALLRRVSQERQTTIVMATHSPEAAAFAHRIVHMRDGQIESIVTN